VPDAHGEGQITVFARDPAGAESPALSISILVSSVNDLPQAVDDVLSPMPEDGGARRIQVLTNDYLGDRPSVITRIVGIGTHDVIGVDGERTTITNGTVDIDGSVLSFTPTPNFWGEVSFKYVLSDADGDEDEGLVSFYVEPRNDPPEARQSHRFEVIEGNLLEVSGEQGLLVGSFDIDPAQVDAEGNPLQAEALSVVFETAPPASEGALLSTASDGSFIFRPAIGYTGATSFTYSVFDNALKSRSGTVSIEVLPLPQPASAPNPGEVSVRFNLADTPLEQLSRVPANVVVSMDDSGSMDFNVIIDSVDDNGRFVIDNGAIATTNPRLTVFGYLYDLESNTYGPASKNGPVLPSQESLPPSSNYDVWKARSAAFNDLYYDPSVRYEVWKGLDNVGEEFTQADPSAVRLDPMSRAKTIDLRVPKNYVAYRVPLWNEAGGVANLVVSDFYIPRYYLSTGELVEIREEGSDFPGGAERTDCTGAQGRCSYAEEIQNFANWFQYYRSRELVAKGALGRTVAELQNVRVGYETINRRSSAPIAPMNEYFWEGDKRQLLDTIYKTDSVGTTPLRRALDDAGQILGCSKGGVNCPALPAPEGICQQNFSLLVSDGYWTDGTPRPGNFDVDGPGVFDGGKYADDHADTLADIAMYYYENDLFPEVEDGVPVSNADIRGVPSGVFSDADAVMHQHVKTFAIAFGVAPSLDPEVAESADVTESFAWPSPTSTTNAKIDDLLHAAINGRGRFLSARDPETVKNAVSAAFSEFSQSVSSNSAATFNSSSLREGTLLYRGFYDLRNRTGELTANRVSSTGTVSTEPVWSAARLLDPGVSGGKRPDERVLVTYDRNSKQGKEFRYGALNLNQRGTIDQNQLNYIRGERAFEQPAGNLRRRPDNSGLLGDIVNSSPVFVGEPRGVNRDQAPYPTNDLYSRWQSRVKDRRPMVYVGSNDGLLHGFDALVGSEVMGYVPNALLDSSDLYANKLVDFTSKFYTHDYYVDLSPRLNDVYMKAAPGRSKQWLTTLVGGLGAGGKSFFALNVSDPDRAFSDELSAAQSVLWEFSDLDDTYPNDINGDPLGGSVGAITDPQGAPVKDLGYSLSLPVITMSNVQDETGEQDWVAIFGNGPNSTSGIATLFVLFMDRGLDGWQPGDFVKLSTGFGVPLPGEPLAGFPNGLGSPTAVDKDLDGTVDLVYAGDRLGNLFRFELEDGDTDNWKSVRLFTASYKDANGGKTVQPILSKPLVIKHPQKPGFIITFGTGSFVAEEDGASTDIQSIYGLWDPLVSSPPTAKADSKEVRMVQQTMTNLLDDASDAAVTRRIVSANSVPYQAESAEPGTYGWYIDLDIPPAASTVSGELLPTNGVSAAQYPGERAIRRFVFRDGAIFTTTVLPSSSATACFGARPGALLIFDALTGGNPKQAVLDYNNDGYVDSRDLLNIGDQAYAAGLLFDRSSLEGQLVDLSTLGAEGETDLLFICAGNECLTRKIRDLNDTKSGRLSWTQLQATP